MHCGLPSSSIRERTFEYTGPGNWKGQNAAITAVLARSYGYTGPPVDSSTRSVVIPVPLCGRCRSHWRRHGWSTAGLTTCFVLLIGLFTLLVNWRRGPLDQPGNRGAVAFLLLGLLVLTALFVGGAALFRPPIKAKVITAQLIILTGVADNFPGAVPRAARFWGARGSSRSFWTPAGVKKEAGRVGVIG
jgi:hypothetical protein